MPPKPTLSIFTLFSIILYCFVGAGLVLQGLRYLLADSLMDYHLAVLAIPWESIGEPHQTLLLGLLQGFGAGAFCVGLVVILLALGPVRTGALWARWVTPLTAGSYAALLFAVTRSALLPGATPIVVTGVLFVMVCLAALCSKYATLNPH